MTGVDPGTGE
ncbi:hypothetical protein MOC05_19035 [Bacillus sonorensis]|nr:hypothetical protein [Bacillus sonorensis]